MHRGYTKRWRKRWDNGYHKDFLLWVMMDYFIDHANHKEKEFPYMWKGKLIRMIKLERGQHFFTVSGLTELLYGPKNKVTRKTVRGRLEILCKMGFLGIQSTQHYSIATILNYDKYNDNKASTGQAMCPTIDPTMEHQSTQQKTTPNKLKELKELKEIYPWLNIDLWKEFLKMRTSIKKPVKSEIAVTRLLNQLKKLVDSGYCQDEVMGLAIEKCWQGFYEPKGAAENGKHKFSDKNYSGTPDSENRWLNR